MAITNQERVGKAMEQVRGEKRKAGGSLIEAAGILLQPPLGPESQLIHAGETDRLASGADEGP